MTDAVTAAQPAAEGKAGYRKKLIEVALPLEAINRESAREKSIRHGHPSTLHLWWARRPLAACRAVLFAQLVDDPSACPEEFPTEEAQEAERQRLFRIIERLVPWENSNDEDVLNEARREIARSVARTAGIPAPETPEEVWRVLREHAPPVYDPFCGGGSIPLEAQRLGLEAHASDLNPVAVLITKALIEIPPKFKDMPPVNPEDRGKIGGGAGWKGAAGLAADVRYYGKWMRDEAFKRIGHLYPRVKLPPEQGGGEATVIAWLWARTVKCPNPACGARMPLVRSFLLSSKKGKVTWAEPIVDREGKTIRFEVRTAAGPPPKGTKVGRGAQFRCPICGQIASDDHIKTQGREGRIAAQMMGIVAHGKTGQVYLSPQQTQESAAYLPRPEMVPHERLAHDPRAIWCVAYGLDTFDKLFTARQLTALTTGSDLVREAHDLVLDDAYNLGRGEDYAIAVTTYLAFVVDRLADRLSTLTSWDPNPSGYAPKIANTFSRQALPMAWDFVEGNPFSSSSGNLLDGVEWVCKAIEKAPASTSAIARQMDVLTLQHSEESFVVSTDPPYYDNIGYADLSDYFYVWLRRSLKQAYPSLLGTLVAPKTQELVAIPYRFEGNKTQARRFFESGLLTAFRRIRMIGVPNEPLTVFYAFKQTESGQGRDTPGATSGGWETMLGGLVQSGFAVTGTWPVRTELTGNLKKGVNALASSIVLVCRPRPTPAPLATRREFVTSLRQELPQALNNLQHGNVAPVDLAQASIGPGMAIFSRYSKVLEADGSAMSVRTALQLINQELDAYLAAQEGELDPDTRFCVAWFEQCGSKTGKFGEADVLARAKNTSVEGLVRAGVLQARAGEVRLLDRKEMDPSWDPRTDQRVIDWECAQHLIRALDEQGEDGAARLAGLMGGEKAQVARDLAYRLYAICERKGWAEEALAYNSLVVAWPAIQERAASLGPAQGRLI